jgi:hypothetical protein
MDARFLLDTTICIYIRRRRPPEVLARFRRLRPGEAVISVITYGELAYEVEKNAATTDDRGMSIGTRLRRDPAHRERFASPHRFWATDTFIDRREPNDSSPSPMFEKTASHVARATCANARSRDLHLGSCSPRGARQGLVVGGDWTVALKVHSVVEDGHNFDRAF